MSGATPTITQEQAKSVAKSVGASAAAMGKKALANGRASLTEARDAGMCKASSLASFNKDLFNIVKTIKGDVERTSRGEVTAQKAIMDALAFKPSDPQGGFVFMNSLAMWMEVIGSLFSFLIGAIGILGGPSTSQLVSMFVCSYIIAYALYFCVVLSNRVNLMGLAILGYCIYALLNALSTMSSLILIVPPIFYGIKTLACGYCAFYAYQLRDRIQGAEQIP